MSEASAGADGQGGASLWERRRRQTADEIAGVAHKLFLDNGYSSVSIDDIAAAANCSARTVYRYFGSKDGVLFYDLPTILEALIEALDEGLMQGLRPWRAVTEAMATVFRRFEAENFRIAHDRIRMWVNEPDLRARYMEFIANTEDAVTDSLLKAPHATAKDVQLAHLRAVAAVGAYRVALTTNVPPGEEHTDLIAPLRMACNAIGAGLGDL
jgi:AcrR family transcriptional regulator